MPNTAVFTGLADIITLSPSTHILYTHTHPSLHQWHAYTNTNTHTHTNTDPADKTLWVPERVEGRNVVLQDSTGTAATFRGKHVKVVLPTVSLSLLLMETCRK